MSFEGGSNYRQRLANRQLQKKKRQQAGLINTRASAGPPSSNNFSTPAPKAEGGVRGAVKGFLLDWAEPSTKAAYNALGGTLMGLSWAQGTTSFGGSATQMNPGTDPRVARALGDTTTLGTRLTSAALEAAPVGDEAAKAKRRDLWAAEPTATTYALAASDFIPDPLPPGVWGALGSIAGSAAITALKPVRESVKNSQRLGISGIPIGEAGQVKRATESARISLKDAPSDLIEQAIKDPSGKSAQRLDPEAQDYIIRERARRDQQQRNQELFEQADISNERRYGISEVEQKWQNKIAEQQERVKNAKTPFGKVRAQRRLNEMLRRGGSEGSNPDRTTYGPAAVEIPEGSYDAIDEAKTLIDSNPRVRGSRGEIPEAPTEPRKGKGKKRTTSTVPVQIDSPEAANYAFFGSNVVDAGAVGNSFTPELFEGSTINIGETIRPIDMADHIATVAVNGIRQRLGRAAKRPSIKRSRAWASTVYSNFERDFGKGSIRVMSMEGRRSVTNTYDDASTISQTIQHDHTVVSPTDLKRYKEEMMSKSGSERARMKIVYDRMFKVLNSPENLVPTHRNVNILLSSFDRQKLLNDPNFANKLGLNEANLGDIWRIMVDPNSGYRTSVDAAYAAARRSAGSDVIDEWQRWQANNLDETIKRRNQRLAESGISEIVK
jgi:hypothetical protein